MKINIPFFCLVALRIGLVALAVAPLLMWLDLNAMALRFIQLRGHWPMCPSNLPCHPTIWAGNDSIKTIWDDPIHLRLDPAAWQEQFVLWSGPIGPLLWFAFGSYLSPVTRRILIAVFIFGWICLVADPTHTLVWYLD